MRVAGSPVKTRIVTGRARTWATTEPSWSVASIGAHRFAEGLGPLIVGALVLAIGLSLGGTTGYAINPARDLGPRLAHALLPIAGKGGSDWSYAWIPVLAPIVGAVAGAMAHRALF